MVRQLHLALFLALIMYFFPMVGADEAGAATQMPTFELEEVMTGSPIPSSTFQGKSLLVTFWATWCPPCVQEIPSLIKLQNEYSADGFSVVAISVDRLRACWDRFSFALYNSDFICSSERSAANRARRSATSFSVISIEAAPSQWLQAL